MVVVTKLNQIHTRAMSGYSREVRHSSLLATVIGYFTILYLYSSLASVVMMMHPAIKVAYFLYFMIATLPFLAAFNRSVMDIIRDHWPFVSLMILYFGYVSLQYAFLGMATLPPVREAYFEKGQFFAAILFSLVAFELSFNFRHLLIALYFVVIVSCIINVVEFFDPMAFSVQLSTVPGRAAGLYQNPNGSALFIASTVPLLCGGRGVMARLVCYIITGIGTFLTFSRGGWALWLVAVSITELARVEWKIFHFNEKNIALIAAGTICFILLVAALGPGLSLLIGELGTNLDANTVTRLELLANDTTIDRLELAREGLRAFTTAPIFGHGVGYTWQWVFGQSVHNMFVLMLAEQGMAGFLWLMALLVVWWRYPKPYGWWLTILFCIAAMATHNYFDGPISATLISLYLVAPYRLPRKPHEGTMAIYAQKRFPFSVRSQS